MYRNSIYRLLHRLFPPLCEEEWARDYCADAWKGDAKTLEERTASAMNAITLVYNEEVSEHTIHLELVITIIIESAEARRAGGPEQRAQSVVGPEQRLGGPKQRAQSVVGPEQRLGGPKQRARRLGAESAEAQRAGAERAERGGSRAGAESGDLEGLEGAEISEAQRARRHRGFGDVVVIL